MSTSSSRDSFHTENLIANWVLDRRRGDSCGCEPLPWSCSVLVHSAEWEEICALRGYEILSGDVGESIPEEVQGCARCFLGQHVLQSKAQLSSAGSTAGIDVKQEVSHVHHATLHHQDGVAADFLLERYSTSSEFNLQFSLGLGKFLLSCGLLAVGMTWWFCCEEQEESINYVADVICRYMKEEAAGGSKHLFMISAYSIGKERIFWKVSTGWSLVVVEDWVRKESTCSLEGGFLIQVHEECRTRLYISPKKYGVLACQDADAVACVFVTGNV